MRTHYRWQKRLKEEGPRGLEEKSRRPKWLRRPTWGTELALEVLHLREKYPRWGKDKLVVLLRREGWQVSTSMVGRILTHLKARGVLKKPVPQGSLTDAEEDLRPQTTTPLPLCHTQTQGYQVQKPGDLVEVDILDVRPPPGVVLPYRIPVGEAVHCPGSSLSLGCGGGV